MIILKIIKKEEKEVFAMKNNLAKRITAMFILVAMLFTMLPMSIFANDSTDVDDSDTSDKTSGLPGILDGEDLVDFPLTFRDVSTTEELQTALNDGIDAICLTSDMELNRTFYITSDTIIYCERAVTLTRSATFAGDIFVVGQNEDGTLCEDGVTFSLGSASDHERDVLTINGNSENMTVDVVGTVVFVCPNSQADFYNNLVITNCKKVGNERALDTTHGLSNSANVGGAVAIVSASAKMNVYGGVYSNNSVNTSGTSVWGGNFYNFGRLNIYDAVIEGGSALRAGAIYNYRTMCIYGAEIKNNTAAGPGGAIYLPASTAAKLYLGMENDFVEGNVIFSGNSADTTGGAIYSSGAITGQNTVFENNSAENGGAIGGVGNYVVVALENTKFINNSATEKGGAITMPGHNTLEKEIDISLKNVSFDGSSAANGGAISLPAECVATIEGSSFTRNKATASGSALYLLGAIVDMNNVALTENEAKNGVIYASESSNVTINKLTATNNTATSNGGVIYATASTVNVYNSTFKGNYANAGAAMYMYTSAAGGVYASSFVGNACKEDNTGNAATVFIYTGGTEYTVHSCSFIQNTSNGLGGALTISGKSKGYVYNVTAIENSAGKGGFLYITSASTVVTISGVTVSGNTASAGGPIIWGNTANAKLYINKNSFVDLDVEGELPSGYWSDAIKNSLTVYDSDATIPEYTDYSGEVVSGLWTAVLVKNADELEKALADKAPLIKITSDIAIDRTISIDYSATIFSTSSCTIYRAEGFEGDLFVVGTEDASEITLTLGNTESNTADYLIIDGSSANVIEGNSLTVNAGATLNIYDNVTITGANNARGAISIVKSSSVNIYGGQFTNNTTKYGVLYNNGTVSITGGSFIGNTSEYGGVSYNNGTLTINGGSFTENTARLGGVIYNRATLLVTNATISLNTATENGGAIYVNKGTAELSSFVLDSNTAVNGGAIALMAGVTTITDVSFALNTAELGGALYVSGTADLTATQNSFTENEATTGGAVYTDIDYVDISNSAFEGNKAQNGGAVALVGVRKMTLKDISATNNEAEQNGGFVFAENAIFALKDCEISGNTAELGGAIYLYNSELDSYSDSITANEATEGGAIYAVNGRVVLNKTSLTANYADYDGGAILLNCSYLSMYNSEAMLNTAANDGGFLLSIDSEIDIFSSDFTKNSAEMNGGALALNDGTVAAINQASFKENTASRNGGAISTSTNGSLIKAMLCVFESNNAGKLGGAVYASNKSVFHIYSSQAISNKSLRGGFLYLTDSETAVTLNGTTVSGNTATNGPIVYGTAPATLYINKENYFDTANANLNSTYFASALYGTLTVKAIYDEIPDVVENDEGNTEGIKNAVDVSSAIELENAINRGERYIRVVSDFEIDRTFYITHNVTIFSTSNYTLTRAIDFGGDIFVVGEHADGTNSMLKKADAKLTLGNPDSSAPNLLTFDGNKENMAVDVCGTLIFICNGAVANLYANVTVTNFHKNSNEKTNNPYYDLYRPTRIGGAVAIISHGSVNVYGGIYKNNSVREQTGSSEEGRASSIGGLFYNESNLKIYDGLFQNNEAARGAIVYNYCMTKIFGGSFIANYASIGGGVYYAASSASSHLNIGFESDSEILFKDNVSQNSGGVIYSSTLNGTVIHGNTRFENNRVIDGNGGAINLTGMLTVKNASFYNNSSSGRGGAIFLSRSSNEYTSRLANIENCTFVGNSSGNGGGALALYSGEADFDGGAIATVKNSEFTANTASYGGAICTDRKSQLTIYGSVLDSNTASNEAGVLYIVGQSTVSIYDSVIASNTAESHGGAISIRSSYLNINNTDISNNTSQSNGGAIYISYTSSLDNNSSVNINDSTLKGNSTYTNGGAIYATRRAIEGDTKVLTIKATDFAQNVAGDNGGAVLLTAGVDVYMRDVTFISNSTERTSDGAGGAITASNSLLEIDGGVFTKNTCRGVGGAIRVDGTSASAILNDIVASKNTSGGSGGFLYSELGTIKLYNSKIKGNSGSNGGALYLNEGVKAEFYNTEFNGNTATGNGGALFVYTYGTEIIVNSCSFDGNESTSAGGAIYASGETQFKLYNIKATNNKAIKGGFMYETKAGTVVTMVGLIASGNEASDGGNLIWGNTYNADLYFNKASYTALDYDGEINDEYWNSVIEGLLTIIETQDKAPSYTDYKSTMEPATTNKPKTPVSVSEIFDLALNSSDGYIDKVYDKFPVLDNSSNFMSNQTTYFENINGGTVSVDTFVYKNYSASGNMNVGEGLMIYQAMLYKQANPDKEVYIDISSYRFSVQAAVNINRDSRYFGYMRQLSSGNYDQYGFVRIAYLLVSAARMGIHVNVIGHSDAYPLTSSDRLSTYFTNFFNNPCDPSYVKDGVIGDYMTFTKVAWTIGGTGGKGGTDMMHVKLCAVSNYLDMNGVEHDYAVWTSSSNLDGIYNKGGYNANWKQQTATIISGHEAIYNVAINYLRLIPQYKGQEEIIEFQNYINTKSTQQIDLNLAGRGDEIPMEERIVYVGTENDDVFEFYFTPFAGDILSWNEIYSPYCKYLRELYDSEDYIVFTWNAAEYASGFPFGQQIEQMIIDAFHNNKNPKNKIYANMESFDASTFDDLVVGVDIGFKSINKWENGSVHNKDLQFSYVKDGVRYYVSLLNSCNMHAGSMYYQPNQALVIKEKTCASDSVFSTVANLSTTGQMVEHTPGEVQVKQPTATEHGYKYTVCQICGEEEIVQTIHSASEWIIDKDATENENGIRHTECTVCGELMETQEILYTGKEFILNMESWVGNKFSYTNSLPIDLSKAPLTFEATIQLSKDHTGRGGVIVSNYGIDANNAISIEIYTDGRVRLFFVNQGMKVDCLFDTDVRSDERTHIAITAKGQEAYLYVNGELAETKHLSCSLPKLTNDFKVGGDNRGGNAQYFKGTIYSVSLFSDVRTEKEIANDAMLVLPNASNLIYSKYFTKDGEELRVDTEKLEGMYNSEAYEIKDALGGTPNTIEATIKLPSDLSEDLGVIVGNYVNNTLDSVSLEVVKGGFIKLSLVNGGAREEITFETAIEANTVAHIAVVANNNIATLYVNGEAADSKELTLALPNATENYLVGGDLRASFKGTIYSVNLFDDVRSADEIKQDMILVARGADALLASINFNDDGTVTEISGQKFDKDTMSAVGCVTGRPLTFEAIINVPTDFTGRAGVVMGNYGTTDEPVSIEIIENGRVRLYFVKDGVVNNAYFKADVRSDGPTHIAITMENSKARLYVNGVHTETKGLYSSLPDEISDITIGGDARDKNAQYFKGTIYGVALFDDIRTAEEIKQDAIFVPEDTEGLIYQGYFAKSIADKLTSIHKDTVFVIDVPETENESGFGHYECIHCGTIVRYVSFVSNNEIVNSNDYTNPSAGIGPDEKHEIGETFSKIPLTYEAIIQLSKTYKDRAGVIMGNYDGSAKNQVNIEIYTNGNPRLYYKVGGVGYSYVFKTDIRSDKYVHMAITIDGLSASLYLNGELVETIALSVAFPSTTPLSFSVGADNRATSPQSFKGKIYSASMFSDVRTAEEIKLDTIMVTSDADNLLFTKFFVDAEQIETTGPWTGTNGVFVGDSITYGTNCEGSTYWELLGEALGFENVTGLGVPGSCISGTSDYGANNSPLIDRYDEIPEADLISIFMGTNDYGHDTPLGTIDDETDVSFYGALNVIIPALLEKYPNSTIVFITPLHRYGFGINSATGETYTYDTELNGAGHTLEDYVNAIKEVCEKYSVDVIDLYELSDLDPSIDTTRELYMEDGLHLNSAGHKYIANILEFWFNEIGNAKAE